MSNARNLANVISGNYDIPAGSLDNAVPANGSITIAKLSATGTPSSSTYLRGDGAWAAAGGSVDVQTFNASGTWTKPSTGSMARIQVWSGGAGGMRYNVSADLVGGAGGGYIEKTVPLSTLGATESVIVGAGGAGRTASSGLGSDGGNSSFGSHVIVYGGSGGGSGGNPFGVGFLIASASQAPFIIQDFNGGCTGSQSSLGGNQPQVSRSSIYGGGGGGAYQMTTGGYSYFGGNGGNVPSGNGSAPGGGGAAGSSTNQNAGNGAAGRVIVTVW